jgi:hypothetical protein
MTGQLNKEKKASASYQVFIPNRKDVLHYLLKGTQPIILASARGLKKRLEPELKDALDKNRLLLITPFSEKVINRIF